jgi:hypothetical protein
VIIRYTELPEAAGGWPRPLLDVSIAEVDDVRVPCLVDSGALNTLLPAWVAGAAGIDLRRADRRSLSVAAARTRASFVTARLSAAGHAWEAEIGFCEPWPYGWGLLGHHSFFRFFTVIFRAADFEFEVLALDQ